MWRRSEFLFDMRQHAGIAGRATLLVAVAALAGCSTDFRRLENPTYAIGERTPVPQESVGRRNAGAPAPITNPGWPNSGPMPGAVTTNPASEPPSGNDRVASLPATTAPVGSAQPIDTPRKPKVAAAAPGAPVAQTAGSTPIVAGDQIEVQQGDTLYAISKRHRVSIAALMELNNLKDAKLRPGQKLVLPANRRRPAVKQASGAPASAVGQAPVAPAARAPVTSAPTAVATDWDGSYVVKSGDSLYGIARAHKVPETELQRINGIVDARKMRPGMILKVPSGAGAAPSAAAAGSEPPRAATVPATPAPAAPSGGVKLLNPPADAQAPGKESAVPGPKVAVLGPAPLPAGAAGKFRWPARGTVLAGFGKRPDGAHNDGINIAVPAGTDITAADAGTVAYAGSEIKAYGNLILIRHDGGWVTAYAHAEQILVKRGDAVTRGQVIAKSGATGTVDQPQVHFELRQGSKPVDPMPHMDK